MTERERFEAWARTEDLDLRRPTEFGYENRVVDIAWLAWQAASAPTERVPREPTADMLKAAERAIQDGNYGVRVMWIVMYDAAQGEREPGEPRMIRYLLNGMVDRSTWPTMNARKDFPYWPTPDELADALDAALASERALREALRKRAVGRVDYGNVKPSHMECDECKSRWSVELPERHDPGCLCDAGDDAPR